jgi:hypothetical protein
MKIGVTADTMLVGAYYTIVVILMLDTTLL